MTKDSQAPQFDPPITLQQLKDEIQKLLEGKLTREEAHELESVKEGDKELLDYFLLRSALRRCMRIQLASDRDEQSSGNSADQ